MKKTIKIFLLSLILLLFLSSCGSSSSANKTISFADAGWDSVRFHNALAGTILQKAYGYDYREIAGSTPITYYGIINDEIDIHMEVWTDNLANYDQDKKDGKFQEVSTNFDDNKQGFFVPTYMIEGDQERGIEATTPDLKTVEDLKKYPDILQDEENPSKGRIYGAIPGWEVDQIMFNKYKYYGLDKNFIYFRPGSEAALATAIQSSYEKGKSVVAYYWGPTWLLGKYDMTLLEDAPFDPKTYKNGETELPAVNVTICISNKFFNNEENKKVVDFLSKYKTSSALTSEALAHMQDSDDNYKQTAIWFMKKYPDLLKEWIGEKDAKKVIEAINE